MAALTSQSTQVLSVFESVVVEQTKDFLFSVGKEFPDLNKIALNIKDLASIKKNISLIVLITYTRIYNKRPQGLELSDKGKVDELANLKILIQSVAAGAEELGGQENAAEISADVILTGGSRADAALHLHALIKVLDQLHRTYTRQLPLMDGADDEGNDEYDRGGYGGGDDDDIEYGGGDDDDEDDDGINVDEQDSVEAGENEGLESSLLPTSRAARAAMEGGVRTTTKTTVGGCVVEIVAAEQGQRSAWNENDGGVDCDVEVGEIDRDLAGGEAQWRGQRERQQQQAGLDLGRKGEKQADGPVSELERGALAFIDETRKQRAAKLRRQQAVHTKVQATKERNSKTQQRADLAKKLRFQGDLERLQLGRELRTEATHKRSVDNLMLKVLRELARDSAEDDALNAEHLKALEQQRISAAASQGSLFRDRAEMFSSHAAQAEAYQKRMLKEQEKFAEAVLRDAALWQDSKLQSRLRKLSCVEEGLRLQQVEAQSALAHLFNTSRLDFLAEQPDRIVGSPKASGGSSFEHYLRQVRTSGLQLKQQQRRTNKARRLKCAYGSCRATATPPSPPPPPPPRPRPPSGRPPSRPLAPKPGVPKTAASPQVQRRQRKFKKAEKRALPVTSAPSQVQHTPAAGC